MKKRILIVLAIMVLLSLTVFAACQEECQHDYDTVRDENNHWQECKLCQAKKDVVPHDLKWISIDATNHWQECACGHMTTAAPHTEGADGKCSACGRDLHAHAYEWKFDAVNHWEECSCGDKKAAETHFDVKNNETQAEGADGKCDVCALEIYVVTFDMQGHGEAIDAQNIGKGGKAAAPAAPADDDEWKFGGWYKEAACENAFDFATETITADTTVYAKWTEDTTEGASKAHAYALALGTEKYVDIQKDQVVYLVYSSSLEGRYTISLGNGLISQKCTFTVDKAEGTYDGTHSLTLDLSAGEKVYIMLTCAEELADDATAGVLIDEVTDEPLPADLFPSGEYSDSSEAYVFEFNHDTKGITYVNYEWSETAKYIGGKYNQLKFVHEMSAGSTIVKDEYTLKALENGSYELTSKSNGSYTTVILNYVVPQDPIPVAKFSGVYAPKEDGAVADQIALIGIYSDGSGYYIRNGSKIEQIMNYGGVSYNQKRNTLIWEQYSITLNLDGDTVVGISISGRNIDGKIEYALTTKAPLPKTLPLTSKKYVGDDYTISKDDNSDGFRWGSSFEGTPLVIFDYDSEEDIYTVKNENTSYQLKIEENTIKLYDAKGETLLATLVEYVNDVGNVPVLVSNGQEQTLNTADFEEDYYWFKVTEGGWYQFTKEWDLTIYCGLEEVDPSNAWNGTMVEDGKPVKIDANTFVAINIGNYWPVPETVSFAVTAVEAPAGLSEDKPVEIVNGAAVINGMDNANVYYVRYQGLEPGTYRVGCTYDDWGTAMSAHFVINNVEYGRVYDNGTWQINYVGGVTEENPYVIITISEATDLMFTVDAIELYWGSNDVDIVFVRDNSNATELTEDSGSLEAGAYKLANLDDVESITITTSEGESTLTLAEIRFGFEVGSAATYVVNYALGSIKNPVEIAEMGTIEVDGGSYVTITAPADKSVLLVLGEVNEYGDKYLFGFEYNDETYGYIFDWDLYAYIAQDKAALSIAAGASVTVYLIPDSVKEQIPVIVMEDYISGANEVELVKGTPADDKIVASATISASGVYYIETTIGADVTVTSSAAFTITMLPDGTEIVATLTDDVYTATIDAGAKIYFSVTLADGQTLALSAEYAKGSQGNPKEVELVEGSVEVEVKAREEIYIVLAAGTYTYDAGDYFYGSVSVNGQEVYSDEFTVVEGDIVSISGGFYGATVTFTEVEA